MIGSYDRINIADYDNMIALFWLFIYLFTYLKQVFDFFVEYNSMTLKY